MFLVASGMAFGRISCYSPRNPSASAFKPEPISRIAAIYLPYSSMKRGQGEQKSKVRSC